MFYQLDTEKLHQDLIWTLSSPQLMTHPDVHCGIATDENLVRWASDTFHQQPLIEHLQPLGSKRLGIYFEALWRYVLQQHESFDLIAHNLPVRANGVTLGEFDFIYFCHHRKKHYHLETAVKFYLGIPDNSGKTGSWSQWVGPGKKDRLNLKLDKLLYKQSQLSRTDAGAAEIANLGIQMISPEICLKGYFFYPFAELSQPPNNANDQHLKGYWLSIKDFHSLLDSRFWLVVDKASWLAPISVDNHKKVLSSGELYEQLCEYFASNQFPKMVVDLVPTPKGYQESRRYFITPDNWAGY